MSRTFIQRRAWNLLTFNSVPQVLGATRSPRSLGLHRPPLWGRWAELKMKQVHPLAAVLFGGSGWLGLGS